MSPFPCSDVSHEQPDPLCDAVAFLSGAVERLAVGNDPPRERVLRALEYIRLAERSRDTLPVELRERLVDVDEWIAVDPSLRDLSDRDVSYLIVGVVRAFQTA